MAKNGWTVTLSKYWGKSKAEVRKEEDGTIVVLTHSVSIIPLAIIEALIVGTLMTMNYLFRYDTTVQSNSDMVDFNNVLLTCDESELRNDFNRPFFDYDVIENKSLEGLQLLYDLPEWVFFLCALIVPIGIFCIIEGFRALYPRRVRREIETFGFVIPQPIRRLVRIIGCFLIGGSIAGIFASIFKLNVASPRPHFMSVCFPNSGVFNSPPSCATDVLWKPSIDCINQSVEVRVEALKSFPSYHATLAVYCGVFTSAYIIYAAKVRGVYNASILVILGLMSMALIGATHRLSSGYAFPKDIIGGAIIGLVVAYYTVKFMLDSFKDRKIRIIKEILHASKKNQRKEKKLTSVPNHSESESDSDFGSGFSSDEFEKYISQIDAFALIPRAKPESKNQPVQAVNPTINADENVRNFPNRPPPNSSVPKPQIEPPRMQPARSSSSLNRQRYPEPQMQPYNVPRQRNSAPMNSFQGYNNYGYAADRKYDNGGFSSDRRQPRGLSPYYPSSGVEASSHF